MRKDILANGNYYHIFSRSIAKFKVLDKEKDCRRFIEAMNLFKYSEFQYKYSEFCELELKNQKQILKDIRKNNRLFVKIIAYCLMPTHFHIILFQESNNGISKYMSKILNSYSRYFNLKYNRRGPLWEGKFKNVLIENDEQLLHLTRYIHLNPVSADLIGDPKEWEFSSYNEYIGKSKEKYCNMLNLFDFTKKQYEKFVEDRVSYQKEISSIKHLLIENYSG